MPAELSGGSGDEIRIRGYGLVEELVGHHSFPEVFYLLAVGRLPSESHARMLDALLVTLADHGLTPSAIAARLTYLGSPESLQGAVAAGLLGAGSHYLGTVSDVADLLRAVASDHSATVADHVERLTANGRHLPGYGHPIHRDGDPRAAALHAVQLDLGIEDAHMRLAMSIGEALSHKIGRSLPLNAAGAIGAIVCDLGLPSSFGRGIAVVARAAGLVAHVLEEQTIPIGEAVWEGARKGHFSPGENSPDSPSAM